MKAQIKKVQIPHALGEVIQIVHNSNFYVCLDELLSIAISESLKNIQNIVENNEFPVKKFSIDDQILPAIHQNDFIVLMLELARNNNYRCQLITKECTSIGIEATRDSNGDINIGGVKIKTYQVDGKTVVDIGSIAQALNMDESELKNILPEILEKIGR